MIHHVSIGTNDLPRAKAFYRPLMALIGFRLMKETDKAAHYGASDIDLSIQTPVDGHPAAPGNGVHVAFQAPDRDSVRRFYAIALQPVGQMKARPVSAKITTPTIMVLSFAILTETRSKQ
jgi:catechol 2,3-dioxygenase-like lactoylglutathione lyase family enzyme